MPTTTMAAAAAVQYVVLLRVISAARPRRLQYTPVADIGPVRSRNDILPV